MFDLLKRSSNQRTMCKSICRRLSLEQLELRHLLAVLAVDDGSASAPVFTANEGARLIPGFVEVVPLQAIWHYLDEIGNGSGNQPLEVYPVDAMGRAWNELDFQVETSNLAIGVWETAVAPFEHGSINAFQFITPRTAIDAPSNEETTVLYRHTFSLLSEQATLTEGVAEFLCDDGCVIYINGVEVFRQHLPDGPVATDTLATATSDEDSLMRQSFTLPDGVLRAGENVVAVETHNEFSSSDTGMELSLFLVQGASERSVLDNDDLSGQVGPVEVSLALDGEPRDIFTEEPIAESFVLAPDGTFELTPIVDYAGKALFRYSVIDDEQAPTVAAAYIEFTPVNDLPVAIDDRFEFSTSRPIKADGATQQVISFGDQWRYFDAGAMPGNAWTQNGFDDSSWKSGSGEFGYGDGDENTIVDFGVDPNSKYPATYFRKTFDLDDPTEVLQLAIDFIRDDGIVVYINGVEVVRDNLALDADFATQSIIGADEIAVRTAIVNSANLALRETGNVIAAEIRQVNAANVDVSFDLRLVAGAPTVIANDLDIDTPQSELTATIVDDTAFAGVATLTLSPDGTFEIVPVDATTSLVNSRSPIKYLMAKPPRNWRRLSFPSGKTHSHPQLLTPT